MARLPMRQRAYAVSLNSSKASSGSYKNDTLDPFGPSMAQDIFDVYEYDDCEETSVSDCYEEKALPEDEYWYQTELPLENVRELEDRFRHEIKKFDRAYRKMMVFALKWHYLMEEVEENPQIKKMFGDMQMVRKLSGSDRV